MKPIDRLVKYLKDKWGNQNKGRVPSAREVLAAVYDPETNSLKGGS